MTYDVLTIHSPEELSRCPVFHVDQFNWGGSYRPSTSGRLGYIPKSAFILEMECKESDPCRTFRKDNDPVYLDSAKDFPVSHRLRKTPGPSGWFFLSA